MTYKVLIVDDSKLARMSFTKILKGLRPSWTRFEAANADEAMDVIGAEQPDIVLLDFNMPGRDGLEIAVELQKNHPAMPIAIISANIQVEIVARAEAANAVFLPKPLTEDALGAFLTQAERRLGAAPT